MISSQEQVQKGYFVFQILIIRSLCQLNDLIEKFSHLIRILILFLSSDLNKIYVHC